MSKIIITGHKSKIAREFSKLAKISSVGIRCEEIKNYLDSSHYFFCQGYLAGKSIDEISIDEFRKTMYINYSSIRDACNLILESNKFAKICVISSYSAYRGSYDETYALSKSKINNYIEKESKIKYPDQQIFGIAPWIIEDAGMTIRRDDTLRLEKIKNEHPLKRFSTSMEIAKLAYDIMFKHNYINRTVIKMNGGAD